MGRCAGIDAKYEGPGATILGASPGGVKKPLQQRQTGRQAEWKDEGAIKEEKKKREERMGEEFKELLGSV